MYASDDFEGDVLKIEVPSIITTLRIPIIVPYNHVLNCSDIHDDITNKVTRYEIMLHAQIKEKEYLSKEYFDRLDSFISDALTREVNNSKICCFISDISLSGDPHLVVIVDEDDMKCAKKLLRIIEHSNVFAVPIFNDSIITMGYYGDPFNNLYRPADSKCSHFALCLGRINDTFLII